MHYVNAKGILSANNGMNVYRGCTHGCIYCDSRSTCYGFTHDFEDIEIKQNAPELLEKALRSKRKKCMIGTGAMCDPYMHCEKSVEITKKCLELIYEYGYGLALQTKSDLILRDLELLKSIHKKAKCVVQITMTTFDEALCKIIEPNVCTTKRRFEVLEILRDNGIPTVVWLTPILPLINDTRDNLEGILNYCTIAKVQGIINFGMGVTLREGDREYFYEALDKHFPGLREKYHQKYGYAYDIKSDNNSELMQLLYRTCKEHNIMCKPEEVFAYLHKFPDNNDFRQMSLFEL